MSEKAKQKFIENLETWLQEKINDQEAKKYYNETNDVHLEQRCNKKWKEIDELLLKNKTDKKTFINSIKRSIDNYKMLDLFQERKIQDILLFLDLVSENVKKQIEKGKDGEEEEKNEIDFLQKIPENLEKRVRDIWKSPSSFGKEKKIHKVDIDGGKLKTLDKKQLLIDNVIDCFLSGIASHCNEVYPTRQDSPFKNMKKCNYLGTYFYEIFSTKSEQGQKDMLQRWTKRHDYRWNEKDRLVIMPINMNKNHWVLCVADYNTNRITFYDSMLGHSQDTPIKYLETVKQIVKWMDEKEKEEKKEEKKEENKKARKKKWNLLIKNDAPQQQNGYDCGVFTCKFAEALMLGLDVNQAEISQENIPYFRKRMAAEIVSEKYFFFS